MLGTALQSTISCTVCGYGELEVRRKWWWLRGALGRLVMATAMSRVATGVRWVRGRGVRASGQAK